MHVSIPRPGNGIGCNDLICPDAENIADSTYHHDHEYDD